MFSSIKLANFIYTLISLIILTHSANLQDPSDSDNQCSIKLNSSLITCEGNLQNRLDLSVDMRSGEYEITGSHCCYLAEFTHCVETLTQEKCAKQIDDLYSSGNFSVTTSMISGCKDYSLYGVTCTLLIHITYIIAAAVILGIIAVVCCIIGYRRWHMLKMEAKQTMNPFNKY